MVLQDLKIIEIVSVFVIFFYFNQLLDLKVMFQLSIILEYPFIDATCRHATHDYIFYNSFYILIFIKI